MIDVFICLICQLKLDLFILSTCVAATSIKNATSVSLFTILILTSPYKNLRSIKNPNFLNCQNLHCMKSHTATFHNIFLKNSVSLHHIF